MSARSRSTSCLRRWGDSLPLLRRQVVADLRPPLPDVVLGDAREERVHQDGKLPARLDLGPKLAEERSDVNRRSRRRRRDHATVGPPGRLEVLGAVIADDAVEVEDEKPGRIRSHEQGAE